MLLCRFCCGAIDFEVVVVIRNKYGGHVLPKHLITILLHNSRANIKSSIKLYHAEDTRYPDDNRVQFIERCWEYAINAVSCAGSMV